MENQLINPDTIRMKMCSNTRQLSINIHMKVCAECHPRVIIHREHNIIEPRENVNHVHMHSLIEIMWQTYQLCFNCLFVNCTKLFCFIVMLTYIYFPLYYIDVAGFIIYV
jgi:hypothetical protein